MDSPRKKTTTKAVETKLEGEDEGRRATLRPDEMPPDVLEFITAIDDYKRLHQRPFPTWSEVLEVVKRLGYARSA
jgi:hypothetical protein